MKYPLLLLAATLCSCTGDGRVDAEAVRAMSDAAEQGVRTYDQATHPGYYRPGYMPPVVYPNGQPIPTP